MAAGEASTAPDSDYEKKSDATYYVQRNDDDERDTASSIRDALAEWGLNVASGSIADTPDDIDFLVQYTADWRWGGRMFLTELRVEVRDPKRNYMLGFGESVQNAVKAMTGPPRK